MNDIDTLYKEMADLRAILESLTGKLGYVISQYDDCSVVTPAEESDLAEEWKRHAIEATVRLAQMKGRSCNQK